MSRPRKTERTVDVHIMLPQDLVLAVELRLFSELQQRIPLGARARFYEEAARRYLATLTEQEAAHATSNS